MPSFVGQQSGYQDNITTLDIAYTPSVGNVLLLFISTADGGTTAALYDNAGVDIFGNQLNAWVLIQNIAINSLRGELWACVKVVSALTQVTIQFSEENAEVNTALLEYTPAALSGSGATTDTGYSNLYFTGGAPNASSIMVTMFSAQDQEPMAGIGTPQQIIPASTTRASIFQTNNYNLILEQDTIGLEKLQSEVIFVNPSTGVSALGVVLSGGIALSSPPGFSPVDASLLAAGDIDHAFTMDQISQNANFGMVRPEFFYTTQVDGDTVPLPVSPADGYNYVRDELIYVFVPLMTFDPKTNWSSGAGILFFTLWDVDPLTGAVTSNEYYHPDGNVPINKTSDGQLLVLTVAQRGYGGLDFPNAPSLGQIPFGDIGEDKPMKQRLIQTLANNSLFAAVKAEVIFMGEFINGQQIPNPVSPEDGYVYGMPECKFISSWRWTANPTNFGPPPTGSDGGWSQMNEMTASISDTGVVSCNVTFYNHGIIDPTTPTFGSEAYGRIAVFAFCQRNKGPYFGMPTLDTFIGLQGSTNTGIMKFTQNAATITGYFSVALQSGTSVACVVTNAVIKKCLKGSLTVLSTTNLTFASSSGVSIPANSIMSTDPVGYTLTEGYDYYIMVVYSGSYSYCNPAGQVNTSTPLISNSNTGDLSGDTTIPSLSYSTSVWDLFAGMSMTICTAGGSDEPLADLFDELPLTAFLPGQCLPYTQVQQLAQNVQEGSYAVEYFGPTTYTNGETVPLPTSPVDGYEYARTELFYIWQVRDTGSANIRLFGFETFVSVAGLVNCATWHVPTGTPPTAYNDTSVDVLVIAVRSALALTPPTATSNPPSGLSGSTYGGSGGYTVNGAS